MNNMSNEHCPESFPRQIIVASTRHERGHDSKNVLILMNLCSDWIFRAPVLQIERYPFIF